LPKWLTTLGTRSPGGPNHAMHLPPAASSVFRIQVLPAAVPREESRRLPRSCRGARRRESGLVPIRRRMTAAHGRAGPLSGQAGSAGGPMRGSPNGRRCKNREVRGLRVSKLNSAGAKVRTCGFLQNSAAAQGQVSARQHRGWRRHARFRSRESLLRSVQRGGIWQGAGRAPGAPLDRRTGAG
jgi:hypothetical protein